MHSVNIVWLDFYFMFHAGRYVAQGTSLRQIFTYSYMHSPD